MKMRSFIPVCIAAIMLAISPAFALDLHSARHAGIVGEGNDGYVKALSGDGDALAASVNAQRQAEYAKISAKNGQPVAVVAKLASAQIVATLAPGDPYQDANGTWQHR